LLLYGVAVSSDYWLLRSVFLDSVNNKYLIIMKKLFLTLTGFFLWGISWAQVGINTTIPQGVFHIDGLGNNNKTGVPTVSEITDDVIIQSDGVNGINIGIGGAPNISASIALNSNKKAFLANIVSLTGTNDNTTINPLIPGMVVYNISNTSNYPNNVTTGYYLYTSRNVWERLLTEWYTGSVSTNPLVSAITTTPTTETELNFGNITTFDTGAYLFALNFRATTKKKTSTYNVTRGIYYVYLYRKGLFDTSYTLVDNAEINPPIFTNGDTFSYHLPLGGNFQIGDKIRITMRHYGNYPSATLMAGKIGTTMSFWRLQ
jgi:hypothetical protein